MRIRDDIFFPSSFFPHLPYCNQYWICLSRMLGCIDDASFSFQLVSDTCERLSDSSKSSAQEWVCLSDLILLWNSYRPLLAFPFFGLVWVNYVLRPASISALLPNLNLRILSKKCLKLPLWENYPKYRCFAISILWCRFLPSSYRKIHSSLRNQIDLLWILLTCSFSRFVSSISDILS